MDYELKMNAEDRPTRNKYRESKPLYNANERAGRHRRDYDSVNDSEQRYSSSNYRRSRSRSGSRERSYHNQMQQSQQHYHDQQFQSSSHYSNNQKSRFNNDYQNKRNKYDEYGGRGTDRFNPGNPSKTIMIRQLPYELSEDDLRTEFNMAEVPYKDVRLIRNRETGQSRGFAFVEFGTVDEAQRWMTATQGFLMFNTYDDNKSMLFYSHSEESNSFRSDNFSRRNGNSNGNGPVPSEWDCGQCGIKNFRRRERCFKCNITREESDKRMAGEGFDQIGNTPCDTIILRGLDALTSEETIIQVLDKLSNKTLVIKQCHIARDLPTNVSNGYAFVEMDTIQDATYMVQLLQPSFVIDGKRVVASFSKYTYATALNQLINQYKISSLPYNQQTLNSSTNVQSYACDSLTSMNQNQTNSAAAIAQAALMNMYKKQEILSHLTSHLTKKPAPVIGLTSNLIQKQATTPQQSTSQVDLDSSIGANLQLLAQQVKKYATPDITKFTYDEKSGYYYDYTTGFYYDAVSQYYYNSLTRQYMYWDQANMTYVPVTTSSTVGVDATSTGVETATSSDAAKSKTTNQAPVKTAAQIAKDMEKWAENMNKKKEKKTTNSNTFSITFKTNLVANADEQSSTNDSSSLQSDSKNAKATSPTTTSISSFSSLTQSTQPADETKSNGDSDSNNSNDGPKKEVKTDDDESSLIDTTKMTCLLCKRKFDSLDILNKHVAKSDLHKTNLEKLRNSYSHSPMANETSADNSLTSAMQYRDRAKERRQKYGTPEPPSASSSSSHRSKKSKYADNDLNSQQSSTPSSSSSFSASSTACTEKSNGDSVANKLMKKMGWNEGSGIGKNLQGISEPIQATIRQKGAGLGSASYDMDPNDSYKDAVRKSARARYEQLN